MKTHTPRPAFTLIETLVSIAILSLLTALTLSGVQRVRATAARVDCQSRMRQVGLAVQNSHATHRRYPEGVAYPFSKTDYQAFAQHAGISWLTAILPQLEQDELWRRAWAAHSVDPSGNSPAHVAVSKVAVKPFRCPADSRPMGFSPPDPARTWALNNYPGVCGTGLFGNDGILHANYTTNSAGVTDGTSNTLLFGERPSNHNGVDSSWYSGWGALRYFGGQLMPVSSSWADAPPPPGSGSCPRVSFFETGQYDSPCHRNHFWSLHPGGANFAFADGSVRFLRYSAVSVLPSLATKAGGETSTVPD